MKILDEHEVASLIVILWIENAAAVRRDDDSESYAMLDR